MELTIQVPDTFLPELFQNMPEYAVSFRCTGWDNEKFEFDLIDCEDGKKYTFTRPKAEKGLRILMGMIWADKLPGLDLASAGNFLDSGNWGSFDLDALLQCGIFGDVIYG